MSNATPRPHLSPNTLELIAEAAAIPCFSSYEERIHPWIQSLVDACPGVELEHVPDNNLLITIPGNERAVALSSHLDKINHFEGDPKRLPVTLNDTEIEGQMDDTVGVGLCLSLMQYYAQQERQNHPTLYLLFSEMEESYGLRYHREKLKNQGEGLKAGIGAERLSAHLLETGRLPELVITLDTTPLFKGEPGLALYSKHWEKNGLEASEALIQATTAVEARVQEIHPGIHLANNTNDYLHYGKALNQDPSRAVPCIAIEPAIYPYHQAGEKVFIKDIEATEALTKALLSDYC